MSQSNSSDPDLDTTVKEEESEDNSDLLEPLFPSVQVPVSKFEVPPASSSSSQLFELSKVIQLIP